MQPKPPTTAQVVLGLFIVGQLLFLAASNVFGLLNNADSHVPKSLEPVAEQIAPGWSKQQGHFYHLSKTAGDVTSVWADLTGQHQNWSLFAPNVFHRCAFPAVEFRWDADPATLFLSDNEPSNIKAYNRWGRFRLRRLESALTIYLYGDAANPPDETKAKWRDEIQSFVMTYGELIYAYMQWRYRAFAERNPNLPRAKQVVFLMRNYRINPPGASDEHWQTPTVHRIARWLPDAPANADVRPYQMFNPVTGRFEDIPK